MNLRVVEAFYWAVTLESVTRAASQLCVTQSALSARIASLETELGVLLLDRRDKTLSSHRGWRPLLAPCREAAEHAARHQG